MAKYNKPAFSGPASFGFIPGRFHPTLKHDVFRSGWLGEFKVSAMHGDQNWAGATVDGSKPGRNASPSDGGDRPSA